MMRSLVSKFDPVFCVINAELRDDCKYELSANKIMRSEI